MEQGQGEIPFRLGGQVLQFLVQGAGTVLFHQFPSFPGEYLLLRPGPVQHFQGFGQGLFCRLFLEQFQHPVHIGPQIDGRDPAGPFSHRFRIDSLYEVTNGHVTQRTDNEMDG